MRSAILALALFAPWHPVRGQVVYPPSVQPSDVQAAIVAATPPDCPAPLSDALTATPGVKSKCMPRSDAQRATQVQVTSVITASDGTFSGTWPVPFASTPAGRLAAVEISSSTGSPFDCAFIAGSVTATSFSGKCWQVIATTLPTAVTGILGLVISPITNAAGGLTVRVVGRQ